jgi:hypothetical protein
VSDQYGVRDAACPLNTRRRGGGRAASGCCSGGDGGCPSSSLTIILRTVAFLIVGASRCARGLRAQLPARGLGAPAGAAGRARTRGDETCPVSTGGGGAGRARTRLHDNGLVVGTPPDRRELPLDLPRRSDENGSNAGRPRASVHIHTRTHTHTHSLSLSHTPTDTHTHTHGRGGTTRRGGGRADLQRVRLVRGEGRGVSV